MLHAKSTALEVVQSLGVDLKGKVVLITGGTAGIGLETARALASIHAHVIITARDMVKGEKVIEELRLSTKNQQIEAVELHLDSLESVRSFAQTYIQRNLPLNILIRNAGVLPSTRKTTKDGFEENWGINHLAHHLLVRLLLPVLKASQPARVVVVSSLANRRGGIDYDDWNWEKRPFNMWIAYAQGKTANILFVRQANQLYSKDAVKFFSIHPGTIPTALQNELSEEDRNRIGLIDKQTGKPAERVKTVEQGASTTVWAAIAPELEQHSGVHCEDCAISEEIIEGPPVDKFHGLAPHSVDMQSAQRLWELSEGLVETFLLKKE